MSSSIGLSAVEKNEFNFNNCFMVMQVFEFYIKKVIEFFLKRYIQAPLFYAIALASVFRPTSFLIKFFQLL